MHTNCRSELLPIGVERLGPELYYTEVYELLKRSAESSAFIGHVRLLSAGYPNLRDLTSAVLQKSDRRSSIREIVENAR